MQLDPVYQVLMQVKKKRSYETPLVSSHTTAHSPFPTLQGTHLPFPSHHHLNQLEHDRGSAKYTARQSHVPVRLPCTFITPSSLRTGATTPAMRMPRSDNGVRPYHLIGGELAEKLLRSETNNAV